MSTQRYTTIAGEVIEYPNPSAEVAAFLSRVVAAANDPNVSEGELVELIYGRENPILDQTVFPGRGAVTKAVFADPVYHVLLDLLGQKQVLEGRLDPERAARAYTLTVAEAAERIGVTPDAVRKAIGAKRIPAIKRGSSYWIDPRDADTYRDHTLPRGVSRKGRAPAEDAEDGDPPARAKEAPQAPALRVRCGSVKGQSLRIKAPGSEATGKTRSIVDVVVPSFARALVATSSTKTQHLFVLEPAESDERIEWGPFFVEGRFRIVERLEDAREAGERFKAFRP